MKGWIKFETSIIKVSAIDHIDSRENQGGITITITTNLTYFTKHFTGDNKNAAKDYYALLQKRIMSNS